MSQIFSSAMQLALQQELTYLCRIWELELINGEIFRFTDNNRDLVVDGDIYLFDPGVQVSAILMTETARFNNCTIKVTKSANFLPMQRIRQGSLDGASFQLWVIDHRDPDTYGRIERFAGIVSGVSFIDKGLVTIELSGNLNNGSRALIGELYSRTCRAQLGDARCQVDLEALAVNVTVDNVTDGGYTVVASELVGLADNRFQFGRITWLTGLNADFSDEIKSSINAAGSVTLTYTPRNPISVGDTAKVYPGCDKQVETCGNKFANLFNFRAEPYVLDELYTGVVVGGLPYGSAPLA